MTNETEPLNRTPTPRPDELRMREALERIKKRNEDFVDDFMGDSYFPTDGQLDRYNDWKDATEALSTTTAPASDTMLEDIRMMRKSLLQMQRNGRKQGWNSAYETDMDIVAEVLNKTAKYEAQTVGEE